MLVSLTFPDDSISIEKFLPLTDRRDHSDDDDDDDDTKHQQSLKIISRTFQQITGRGFFFVRKIFSVMSPDCVPMPCVHTRLLYEVNRLMVICHLNTLTTISMTLSLLLCLGLANKHEEGRFFCLN